ncbi:MAG: tRNA uridine-5-carboxymethylaminomethyl(34) synthesis GTPase MnmE [Oscillospiraceae bacterium]|jgi:tRNA modification GTPase|nr:tRNA uridine-5-carboxymethylaminomethyl(34) synthesis GTPase MnmE [Oscillospiraceae bacterium]
MKIFYEDTIAAISTPFAQGGIGTIKISGPNAKLVAKSVFTPVNKATNIEKLGGYRAVFGHVFDVKRGILDEAVLLNFNMPKSYTGENVVELSVHSGLFILKQLLRSVFAAGARPAEPGEFTRRAFLNGKLTLTQAEAVMNLVSANSEQAHNAALQIKQGKLCEKIHKESKVLLNVLGHVAAFIDYPEEVDPVNLKSIDSEIAQVINKLTELLSGYEAGKMINEGISVSVVGKPNVGKSTIVNLLLGLERCIVTDVPGTTRDVIEESIIFDGVVVRLADTAGIRQTDDVVENMGVKLALNKLAQSFLVLAVFDASRPLDELDEQVFHEIVDKKHVIAIINKMDLPNRLDITQIEKCATQIIKGTTHNEHFREEIVAAIRLKLMPGLHLGCVPANERQYNCVSRAVTQLQKVKKLLLNGSLDVASVELENALEVLNELNGENISDLILDDIFGRFCVGK